MSSPQGYNPSGGVGMGGQSAYHSLVYNITAAAAGGTLYDTTAAVDPEFSQRNGHYIFSERYKLIATQAMGVSLTDARFNIPSWNALVFSHIWPFDRAATASDPYRILDYRRDSPDLPVNEEIAVQFSNNLACGTEAETCLLQIAPPNWNRQFLPPSTLPEDTAPTYLPGGGRLRRFMIHATMSAVHTAHIWSGLAPLVFEANLRGGWYYCNNAYVFGTAERYWRLVFPRMPLYRGRRLRPGGIVTHALGQSELPLVDSPFGMLGAFHAFEPPQLEVFSDTSATDTVTVTLDCSWYGYSAPPNYAPTGAEVQ